MTAPFVESWLSSFELGKKAEQWGCDFLLSKGLILLAKNYKTPGRYGKEIDLIMQEKDQTLVFIEVRLRSYLQYGGAGASVDFFKQRRILSAAQYFLMQYAPSSLCRIDVIAFHLQHASREQRQWALEWIQGAIFL